MRRLPRRNRRRTSGAAIASLSRCAGGPDRDLDRAIRTELAAELSRRDFLARAGGARARRGDRRRAAARRADGRAGALPRAAGPLTDATLQAFFDTIVPGKRGADLLTELGNPIDPKAIAGVDPEHGAV